MKHILFFTAPWCPGCHNPALLAALDEAEQAGVDINRIDVDEHTDVAQLYCVSGLPTIVYIDDTDIVDHVTGAGQAAISKIREFAG